MKVGQRILEPDAEISIWQSQRMKLARDVIAKNEESLAMGGGLVNQTLKITVGVVWLRMCTLVYVR